MGEAFVTNPQYAFAAQIALTSMPQALIISPQPWAGFQVSKHHYARALAAAGWEVIFVDPPTTLGRAGAMQLTKTEVPGLRNLRYQTWFPYRVKFYARRLFDWCMAHQARRIAQVVGPLDLVWDFDNAYQFRSLRPFGAKSSLFHLVDNVGASRLGNKDADHVFYLHESFCRNAGIIPKPDHLIGHGLGRAHADLARSPVATPDTERPKQVGFVGNLCAGWMDWDALERMTTAHPDVTFTFWGPVLHPAPPPLARLQARANTRFLGLTPPDQIAQAGAWIDVWIVPYNLAQIKAAPINSHKILEYLSTGKAVVMDWLEAWVDNPLVDMPRDSGTGTLPDLLAKVLADLPSANAPERMAARRAYALARSYDERVAQICEVLGDQVLMLPSKASGTETHNAS
jgi:hypothetical protein